ncbi:MAG: hypothetical protein JHD07_30895 [Bradyrhizobium sp.]|jgi:hypothetical protein|uniref:hypothetical protein n=1 Tax=Bradyrhizobium TaxID=374 RepID=UPI00040FA6A7|nr:MULTISPECIES: hypothetical protein [Bradyrhizobium]MBJ7407473.1 hypothetical protein [Bradyrhizobium sp.]
MNAYLVAVKLLAHAYHNPASAIAGASDGILADMRKHAGAKSALIDCAAIGDAIPSSSVYRPNAAFPVSSTGTV